MKLSRFTLALALIAALLLLASGPGTRAGLWPFPTGFGMLRWASYLSVASVALALAGLALRRLRAGQTRLLVASLVLGLAVLAVPAYWVMRANAVPAIHDISTDPDDPPPFIAVLPLRADAPNPADHAGEAVAEAQRAAYPDIRPLRLPVPPDEAFERALSAARGMDWELVAQDPESGRIEATDTTSWFGFKDDVVIRVQATPEGSVVDMRSKSRVGRSDVGTNAARIRAFLAELAG